MSALDTLFQVAPHLVTDMKPGPNHVMVRCPFHGGGQEKTPSLSISTWKPVFMCYGCKTSGHLSMLLRHFGVAKSMIDVILPRDESYQRKEQTLAAKMVLGLNPYRGRFVLDEGLLDAYRLMPTSLKNKGFKPSTLRHFEVGYDEENLRITYPLRSVFGELLGISGGTIIKGLDPKYRIYERELIKRTDFHVPDNYSMEESKSAVLWHGHIVRPLFFLNGSGKEEIIVTEGFKACMWTYQSGAEDVVATIGSFMSSVQVELIARATRKVTMFYDNNEAGIRGTQFAGAALQRKGVEVRCAAYPDQREQPDDLSGEEVRAALQGALTFRAWSSLHRAPETMRHIKKRIAMRS